MIGGLVFVRIVVLTIILLVFNYFLVIPPCHSALHHGLQIQMYIRYMNLPYFFDLLDLSLISFPISTTIAHNIHEYSTKRMYHMLVIILISIRGCTLAEHFRE